MTERRIDTWSFSRLKTYETCPYQLWLSAGEKRSQDHMKREAADRGTAIHLEAENFVLGKGDFTKNLAKFADYLNDVKIWYENGEVEVEQNWGFTVDWEKTGWWDDNVSCRMKLDQFISREKDAGTRATAVDLKTGKKFGNEVSHSQQGQIYALGSFLRYPELEIVDVSMIYLDHGLNSKKTYTREKAMKFLPMWNQRAEKLLADRVFKPKANKITCKWCPYGPQNGDSSCDWGVDG